MLNREKLIGVLKIPVLISVVLLLLALTPLKAIALVGCIVMWALYWPFTRGNSSLVLRLVIAFALTAAYQQMIAGVFTVVGIGLNVVWVVALQLVTVLILIAAGLAKINFDRRSIVHKADAAALLVAAVSVGTLAYFMLSGGPVLQQLVRQVTTGYDNIQHVSLTQTLYENKGYVWGEINDVINVVKYPNLASYPQGWSMTTSIWWQGLTDDANIQTNPALLLSLYVGFFLLWYALAIFMFCRLVLALVELLRKKANGLTSYAGAIILTVVAQFAFLMAVVYNGFASFLPSILFPTVLVYLIIGLLATPSKKANPYMFLVSGLLLAGGMAFSWLLISPAAFIMVIVSLVAYFNGSLILALKWLFSKWWRVATGVVLVGTAAIQGYVQLRFGNDELVNMPGGINDINNILLVTFLVIALAGSMYYSRKEVKDTLIAALTGGLVVAGVIYLYQFFSSGGATYFSTKAAYVPLLLIVVFGSAALIAFVEDFISAKSGQIMGTILIVSAALFLPIATNMNLGTSPQLGIGIPNYLTGTRFLSPYSASQITGLLIDGSLSSDRLIMFKHLGFAEDITTTHFANMVSRKPKQACSNVQGDLSSGWNINRQQVLACAGDNNLYIIAATSNYEQLVDEYKNDKNITVVLSN